MANARFAAMMAPKGSLLHNDDEHGFENPGHGGGPVGRPSNPSSHRRGGVGAKGQQSKGSGLAGSPKPTYGNPASRPLPKGGEARGGSFHPESRIPGHGGSPQHREREIPGDFHKRGGVGASGQRYVPGGHGTPVTPSGGTHRGPTYRRIVGHFDRRSQGARSSGQESRGKYGSSPVTQNT